MSNSMDNKKLNNTILYKAAGILLLIVFWQIISSYYNNEIIFPTFMKTLARVEEIITNIEMLKDIYVTVSRGIQGIVVGALIGIFLGVVSGLYKYARELIIPVMMFLQATPVISFLLIFLIWFDNDRIPFIVVVISIVPMFAISILEGIKNTDKKLIEMAKFYKIRILKIIFDIYLHSVYGYTIAALKSALGVTFRIVVMAEVLAHPGAGIGDKMNSARINIETVDIFAWTIIVITMTVVFEQIVSYIFEKILTREPK